MPRYQFTSPAAAFSDAIEQTLVARELQKRQAFLDMLNARRTEAEITGSGESRQLARDQFQYQQGRDVAEDQFRNDQARQAATERAAAADAQREFLREQNALNRQSREEQAAHDRELRELIARMTSSNSAESRALADQLRQIQIQTAQDKLDTSRAERTTTEQGQQGARREVADLAASILKDRRLDSRVGMIQGRMPAVTGNQRDFDNQVGRLKSMLSLESRSKLKGTGAISDFEARTLEAAATALDQATDEPTFRRELERIVGAMGGGTERPSAADLIRKYGGE